MPELLTKTSALERMRDDLHRALAKPIDERRWVMVIDLRKCVGCTACTISCVAENRLPPGVVYRPVLEKEIGTFPNVTRRFLPKPCMQCDNPPCVPVCPVNATYKNEEGVVVIDYDQCIGCRYCITACPYAARTFDFGEVYTDGARVAAGSLVGRETAEEYERAAAFEYGESRERTSHNISPVGNVRKCHFCLHRLEVGMLPACTSTCIGEATYFGDANDSESLVAELIGRPNVMRLKEELGTEPRVYYLT
jgi:molybdopterin-containing oxidoreductase family iron-sulfur binding subunit